MLGLVSLGPEEDRLSTLNPSQIKEVTYGLGLQSLSCAWQTVLCLLLTMCIEHFDGGCMPSVCSVSERPPTEGLTAMATIRGNYIQVTLMGAGRSTVAGRGELCSYTSMTSATVLRRGVAPLVYYISPELVN